MEKTVEYNETAAQHIYIYHNTAGKRSIAHDEKVKISVKEAMEWLDSQNENEVLLILKKVLEIAEGKDSCEIRLQHNGEWRMLFMTGDGIDYKKRKESKEQSQATQRARYRCEDLKRRGYLGGTCENLYVTLSGKEYYSQNAVRLNTQAQ